MNKIITIGAFAVLIAAGAAHAVSPAIKVFVAGRMAQVDTNVTTEATQYTPDAIGQVLVGGAGTGTNGLWVAKGTTTNDWVQITVE